jgi:hypothetical protein
MRGERTLLKATKRNLKQKEPRSDPRTEPVSMIGGSKKIHKYNIKIILKVKYIFIIFLLEYL